MTLIGLLAVGGLGRAGNTRLGLDEISVGCIACHDDLAVTETTGPSDIRLENHAVGVSYGDAWLSNPSGLFPPGALDRSIALLDGRITCVSCHRASNREPDDPVPQGCPESDGLTVDRSSLCMACHRI
jgi:hypothetical protein